MPCLHSSHRSAHVHKDVEAHHVCKAMVEGKDDEGTPSLVDIYAGERLLYVGRIVAMRKDDAFRISSRA